MSDPLTSSFRCRCGYSYEGAGQPDFEHDPAFPDACCNCGGQKCTACVSREVHDRCVDDCPDCCDKALPRLAALFAEPGIWSGGLA